MDRLARARAARLRDLRRPAAEPGRAARALPRSQHRRRSRTQAIDDTVAFFAQAASSIQREAEIARDLLAEIRVAPGLPRARRPGLPRARPLGADAVGRRGAAHPPRRAARLEPAGRVLRARRADHRPASARQRSAARRARGAGGEAQHAGRRRARRGHDPPRRSRHRSRARRRRARRRGRRRRAPSRTDAQSARRSPAASCAIRCSIRRSRAAPVDRARAASEARARRAAQPRKDVDVRIPLGRLVVVTGVSGSGKSTLARDVLYTNLKRLVGRPSPTRGAKPPELTGVAAMRGVGSASTACSKSTRRRSARRRAPAPRPTSASGTTSAASSPDTTEARIRGYTASRFSFNTAGGRCEACEGQGVQTIEMSFLPDVKVLCDVCGGPRFNSETLSVAVARQEHRRRAGDEHRRGGGVLRGAPVDPSRAAAAAGRGPGLSHARPAEPDAVGRRGAAHQAGDRAREGARRRARAAPRQKPQHTLYVLDEPTVGLHMADVEKLIHVLHRLVDAGNTRRGRRAQPRRDGRGRLDHRHGPGGGDGGGRIVAEGAPPRSPAARRARTPARCSTNFCAIGRDRRNRASLSFPGYSDPASRARTAGARHEAQSTGEWRSGPTSRERRSAPEAVLRAKASTLPTAARYPRP